MRVPFNRKTLPLAGLLLVLGGCASALVPTEQIELARSAVNRAVAADATQYSPVRMHSAQGNLSAMDRALGEKNYDEVVRLAKRARADAVAAEAEAGAAKADEHAKEAKKAVDDIRKEGLQASGLSTDKPAH
ncbi:MAG: DUF4398 domain-containing protein [Paucimonas sp.]|uniref:DUF4398 domain-containing protein n=1 Tax=Pantoea sp. Cy-639 TaxID=2608360 RepID=UPI00141DD191|nr:DUF4398 domain-containing protein [Pantoea sp. Cy-639]MDR2306680.1 DUF4398 domain-containing protein [Paucimonas sp.]NIF15797.1 DUF4398 domain-containing protein [Pantoea sp. Cy-639]